MAHFAELDENNIVKRVIVINNDVLLDENGNEDESLGSEFCRNIYGLNTKWIKTSYNSSIRGSYAGEGYQYDPILDIFIPAQPYPSWILDKETLVWNAPVLRPISNKEGFDYMWSESIKSWVEIGSRNGS